MLRKLTLFLLVLGLFIFWKPIAIQGIGPLVRCYLQVQKGWDFTYESVQWTHRGIEWEGISVADGETFSLTAEKAVLRLKLKHLDIEHPSLILTGIPRIEDEKWTVVFQEGHLEGPGLVPATFSLSFDQEIWGKLVWPEGTLQMAAHQNKGNWTIDAEVDAMDLAWVKGWVGEEWGGCYSGKIHLESEEKRWVRSSGNLTCHQVAAKGIFAKGEGSVVWEGPIDSWESLSNFHLRAECTGGCLQMSRSRVEDIRGSLHLIEGAGAKWEGEAKLQGSILQGVGQALFQGVQGPWMESELSLGEGKVKAEGKKEGSDWNFRVTWDEIGPGLVGFFADLVEREDSRLKGWDIEEGALVGAAEKSPAGWNLNEVAGSGLLIKKGDLALRCEQLAWHESGYSFAGAGFIFQGAEGKDWSGSGSRGSCFAAGGLESFRVVLDLRGEINSFEASGTLDGHTEGEFAISGGLEGSLFHFCCDHIRVGDFSARGSGWLDDEGYFALQSEQFEGSLTTLFSCLDKESSLLGNISSVGQGAFASGCMRHLDQVNWSLQMRLQEGSFPLFANASLDNITVEIEATEQKVSCRGAHGTLFWGKRFSLYAPLLETDGMFDVRLQGEIWDLIRLAGTVDKGNLSFHPEKSHCLGEKIRFGPCNWAERKFSLASGLSWQSLAGLLPLPVRIQEEEIQGILEMEMVCTSPEAIHLTLTSDTLHWGEHLLPLSAHLQKEEGGWCLETSHLGDFLLAGHLFWKEEKFLFSGGTLQWKDQFAAELSGKFDSLQRGDLRVDGIRFDLGAFCPFFSYPVAKQISGKCEGSGLISWDEELEADFDFITSNVKAEECFLENRTPIHFSYSSKKGVLFSGLDFSVQSNFSAKVGLVQYDIDRSSWIFQHAHLHLPLAFCQKLSLPFSRDLDGTFDIECAADLSTFSCFMKEGFIPYQGDVHHIQNLHLSWEPHLALVHFDLFTTDEPLKVDLSFHHTPQFTGRLTLQDSFYIDWTYDKTLAIHAIEGTLPGLDASFHSEGETLIGSARFDGKTLLPLLPAPIARVFTALELGKGYELMGHLTLVPTPTFQGILSGKQLEFFGFQLRTLLSQVEISPTKVHLKDIKISDTGGLFLVPEILAQNEGSWTLSIPHIAITELRPSLLQRIGKPHKALNPLVVRTLTLKDLHGTIGQDESFTGIGELFFINSFKREHTVFDIPSDLLSRIVGLDLDLLIPVRGSVKYELKDGYFNITSLTNAYSENQRSQFFLVENEISPRMSLRGDLSIFIQMKQFVLFKLTEAFVISIDGHLSDPQFHLQKKKRFLGL